MSIIDNTPLESPDYLTILALEDGLSVKISDNNRKNNFKYRINNRGLWKTFTPEVETPTINAGQTICFKGLGSPRDGVGIGTFTISKKCELTGNCNSLLFEDDAKNNLSLSGYGNAFFKLFANNDTIIHVSRNFLPATDVSYACYRSMFYNCSEMLTAPIIPEITTQAEDHYLAFDNMYSGCSKLQFAGNLSTSYYSQNYLDWMHGVASTGTFIAQVEFEPGNSIVPSGWTVLIE